MNRYCKIILSLIIILIFSSQLIFSQNDNINIVNVDESAVSVPLVSYSGVEGLWRLFLDTADPQSAADILITLGTTGKRNRVIIDNLNNYLIERNRLVKSGASVNYLLV